MTEPEKQLLTASRMLGDAFRAVGEARCLEPGSETRRERIEAAVMAAKGAADLLRVVQPETEDGVGETVTELDGETEVGA